MVVMVGGVVMVSGRFVVVGGGDGYSGGVSSFFCSSETDFPKCSFRDGRKL